MKDAAIQKQMSLIPYGNTSAFARKPPVKEALRTSGAEMDRCFLNGPIAPVREPAKEERHRSGDFRSIENLAVLLA
jgi:hypothetical protein